MNIVLLGAPASGKGSQAELIIKHFNLYYMQTGDLARKLAKQNKRIKQIIDSGKLIPAEEMTMYVIDFLSKQKPDLEDILFEGFPRFISQYEALSEFLKTKGDDIDLVISLEVSEKVAIERISARRVCTRCGEIYNLISNPPPKEGVCECGGKLIQREDDNSEAIKVRFRYYKDNTKKLIEYLDKKGFLTKVDGERPIPEIFEDIKKTIKKVEKRKD